MAPKTIEVTIMGQSYTIKGDADEEYIRTLARTVDSRMKELFEKNPAINPFKAAIIVSINLADQLFQCRKQNDNTNQFLDKKVDALSNLLKF